MKAAGNGRGRVAAAEEFAKSGEGKAKPREGKSKKKDGNPKRAEGISKDLIRYFQ
jgi:hypothetical protein